MKKGLTVKKAIIEVFKRERKPLSPREIFEIIRELNLYKFNTENPISIVSAQLRRHCRGNKQAVGKDIIFSKTKDGNYTLVS